MSIEASIRRLEERIAAACNRVDRSPEEITIVAVTKTVPPPTIRQAFQAGLRHLG